VESRGPLHIQLRADGERIVVLELHPRFSGTTGIRASVGFNEVDVLLRNFLDGAPIGRVPYADGVAVIRAFEHVVVPVSEMEALGTPAAGE